MTEGECCEGSGDSGETSSMKCEADPGGSGDYCELEESSYQDASEKCELVSDEIEGGKPIKLCSSDSVETSNNCENDEKVDQNTLEVIVNESKQCLVVKNSGSRPILYFKTDNGEVVRYELPFPSYIEKIIANPTGKYAHKNFQESAYATDFLLPINTPILAARGGKVVGIHSSSDKWGLDPELAKEANFVLIDHGDGTYAEYIHLGKYKVAVRIGQQVETGDLLGYSGLSGCMGKPHLHFNVFKIIDGKPISIPVQFSEGNYTPKEAVISRQNYTLLKAA